MSKEEETLVRYAGSVSILPLKTRGGLRLRVRTCDTERGSAEEPQIQSPSRRTRQEIRASTVRRQAQIQNSQVGCRTCSLLFPPSPHPPTHQPISPSSSLSLLLLVSASSLTGWPVTAWPIRSTPPRCVGTSGPPCGPASPS